MYICSVKLNLDMYTIQTNKSGTRSMEISDSQLLTIFRYNLFQGLPGSHGVVDESDLDKLRYTVRSLIVSQDDDNDTRELLDLFADVLCHPNMKAYGLNALIALYNQWSQPE